MDGHSLLSTSAFLPSVSRSTPTPIPTPQTLQQQYYYSHGQGMEWNSLVCRSFISNQRKTIPTQKGEPYHSPPFLSWWPLRCDSQRLAFLEREGAFWCWFSPLYDSNDVIVDDSSITTTTTTREGGNGCDLPQGRWWRISLSDSTIFIVPSFGIFIFQYLALVTRVRIVAEFYIYDIVSWQWWETPVIHY